MMKKNDVSFPEGVSLTKISKAMSLCRHDDLGGFFNDLLDVYIKTKVDLKLEHNELTSSSYDKYSNDETVYFNIWSKGEKIVRVKQTDVGVEILSGSDFEELEVESLSGHYSKRREELLKLGYVENNKFVKNYFCGSLSAAASIARGVQLSGPKTFKIK